MQDNLFRVPEDLLPQKVPGRAGRASLLDRYDIDFARTAVPRPRVTYCLNTDGMVGFYRSLLPAREIARRAGWRTTVTAEVYRPTFKDVVAGSDVVCFSVPHDPDTLLRVPKISKKALVVVDIDDNLFELPIHNSSYLFWKDHERTLDGYMKAADIITTPSLGLQNYLEERYARVYLVPNFVDLTNPCWTDPMVEGARRIVGFAGSFSHLHDLKMIEEPMRRVMARVKDFDFVVYGPLELYHALDLPKDRYRWFPPRPYDSWPALLRQFTIGICPLEDTLFNRCKSSLKILETVAAGVLPIASRVGPFVHLEYQIREWASKEKEWSPSEDVIPLFSGPDSFAHTLETALSFPPTYDRQMELMNEYVRRFCTSEQLSRVSTLYANEYRNKFTRKIGQ